MKFFWDTETSGFPDYRLPPDHPDQPQLVQLACLLTDDAGVEKASAVMLVQTMRGPIPKQASDVHGITTRDAEEHGVYPTGALYFWDRLAQMADTIVAHNIKFDWAVIEAAWAHNNPAAKPKPPLNDLTTRYARTARFCTCEAAAPIVNLPPTARMISAGFDKPKAPKLAECIAHLFGEDLPSAHDAMVDV